MSNSIDPDKLDRASVAGLIDHSLLAPSATEADVRRLCEEAMGYGFHSVCVNPCHVRFCASVLRGSGVRVCTVVGFPLGATFGEAKAFEARTASLRGAHEVDMVMNVGAARAGCWDDVRKDIMEVVMATPGLIHKVIIEACYLDGEEKRRAVEAVLDARAEFVKTSTGFGPGGATVKDVELIREVAGTRARIKAAGGIRTLSDVVAMLRAGADRIGTSSGVSIVQELPA